MLKRVLIISPYFPPANAADMHRVRTSLPFFEENGWHPTVVTVDEKYTVINKDDLLLESLPEIVNLVKVKALPIRLAGALGIGNIGLRSFLHFKNTVSDLLRRAHFDLIFFSTTQFSVCALGQFWKRRFRVPYVIDLQDPWFTGSYLAKRKQQLSLKQRLMYGLHEWLEHLAMVEADGLMAVSSGYIDELKKRYTNLISIPSRVITFGSFVNDLYVAERYTPHLKQFLNKEFVNIVYVGRGDTDMQKAIKPVFAAFKLGLSEQPELFNKLRFSFLGTSYAPQKTGIPTIMPLAVTYGLSNYVTEVTDRITYYQTLATLMQADALFIPGSTDHKYTPSKLFPYLLTAKPLLAIFHQDSSAVEILQNCTANSNIFTFSDATTVSADDIYPVLKKWAKNNLQSVSTNDSFKYYSAKHLTAVQTDLFNQAVDHFKSTRFDNN